MSLLPILNGIFLLQLAVFGVLLVFLGLTHNRRVISLRVAKAKGPTAPRVASKRALGWTELFARVTCRDLPVDHIHAIAEMLSRYGVAIRWVGFTIGMARGITAILITAAVFALLFGTVSGAVPANILLAVSAFAGIGIAILGFRRLGATMAQNRRDRVTRKIPYALELILIFLDAGLGLTSAFERVAEALEERQPELNAELRLTIADLRVLGSQDLAFKNMAERIDTPNMHSIVNILRQSIQYGSPISEAMQNAISLMRRTEILLMEEQANKLPSKITLMTLLFIFPPFVVILAGPAMIGLTSALTEF